jgi:hypothetical protein
MHLLPNPKEDNRREINSIDEPHCELGGEDLNDILGN